MCELTKETRERRARGHAGRAAILDLLAEEGHALSAEEIQAGLPFELALTRVEYHLKVLTANGLVVRRERSYTLGQCQYQCQ